MPPLIFHAVELRHMMRADACRHASCRFSAAPVAYECQHITLRAATLVISYSLYKGGVVRATAAEVQLIFREA